MSANKMKNMCFNLEGAISTLNGHPLKLVEKFTYLSSNISSIESDVNMHLVKMWSAIGRLSIIWKFDLSNKIKEDFFHEVIVSITLDRCTTWTLSKHMEKKLDGNCTRMIASLCSSHLPFSP